ncbi:MAG: magnesium transporter [Oscillospiraceae bacterium]|nr:magnesium transporter [Oscillospiraceae bacterium]
MPGLREVDSLEDEERVDEPVVYDDLVDKHTDELTELLDSRNMKALREKMDEMQEFDVAEFLSSLKDNRMPMLFRLLSKEKAAEVFANFDAPDQERIINSITDSELAGIVEELYVDDAVDMMEELPANVVKRVMRTATSETRNLINQYLHYPDNSAGSIMTAEFVDLKKYMSVKDAFARIRRIGEDKETIYICFVTSADRKLEGIVTVKDLLLADPETVIEDLMDRNVIYAMTTEDQESVSEKFSDYDLMAMPVVDKENRLVGIVTVDDIIDVMEQEATEDIQLMAGMTPSDKPYLRTGITEMWKNRIPWLMFLMLSATFTSMILTSFEDRLAVQTVLIAFIPMLMGTGGNSGAQASTAVIRSLSLGDVEPRDVLKVMWKEWRVALLCGLSLAAVNFIKMLLLDGMLLGNSSITISVAATVSVSIVFIVMFAKVVGSFLPIAAEKIGVDPAVMANPLISTLTDAVSLLIYIFVAKLILKI